MYSTSGRPPHAIIPPPEFAPIVNVYPVITANISFPTDRLPISGGVSILNFKFCQHTCLVLVFAEIYL
ncbi:MAG TPA: hypothetical protein VIQ04_03490 [Nitrososphaeraceae archaeon]